MPQLPIELPLTYSSLKRLLFSFLERDDQQLIDAIPSLIAMSQNVITTTLGTLVLEEYAEGYFDVGVRTYPKPNTWRRTVSWEVTSPPLAPIEMNGYSMEKRTKEFLNMYSPPSRLSPPLFFSDEAYNYWEVTPTPDQSYGFKISYISRLPQLSEEVSQNKLTIYFPELLTYGALMQTAPYLKDDPRVATWSSIYTNIVAGIQSEDDTGKTTRNTNIMVV